MFYISSDITILSKLPLENISLIIANALDIRPFVKDESGRWEENEVYVSRCFGLQFMFCYVKDGETPDDPVEFGLSIDSWVDDLEYDGSESDVDATQYVLWLLRRAKEIKALPD